MTESSRQRARSVFMEIADLAREERADALGRACGDDSALRAEVEALLAADASAAGFMASPTAGDATVLGGPSSAAREHEGQLIGRYKLLQPIGEGGFGSVWMAEQREPVKRRVALKVIKLGMDTRQVIARFEAERQALAMMDHPNIAKVLDAGATETGRPYFVMEYIKGVPIVEYCDTERLDTRARLDLFASVCQAIQHAHQKGIIHRDIKSSNVLVTLHDGVPVPKVIDFGIAKATSAELTQKTLFTEHRQMIGTPAYMSPEQAEMSGLDIDTRSDIYSLGVLLYELLTGTTPFATEDLLSKGFAEMMRIIREVEPHKPSTRLSSLGETASRTAQLRRATDPARLSSQLRGDLDWIVMKCLEKDRTRRYESASGLALDIRRHISDEPVSAGPPSASYKIHKFIRRNRAKVVAGTVVAATLVLGVVGTTAGLLWALNERARANDAAQLEHAARLAAQQNFDSLHVVGGMLGHVGRSEEAEPFLREAVEMGSRLLPETSPNLLDARDTLAVNHWRMGKIDLAISSYESVLAIRSRELGPNRPDTLATQANLGVNYKDAGRLPEAIRTLSYVDTRNRITPLPRLDFVGPALLEALSVGADPSVPEHREKASLLVEELLPAIRAELPAGSPELASGLAQCASTLARVHAWTKAEPIAREALRIRASVAPLEWTTANSRSLLGGILLAQDNLTEAEPLLLTGYQGLKRLESSIPPPARFRIGEALDRLIALATQKGTPEDAAAWRTERANYPASPR